MHGKSFIISLIILFTVPWAHYAQQPEDLASMGEELLYRDGSVELPLEIYEGRTYLMNHPLNLNTATSKEMEESGLFTPFQIHVLLRYRKEYGSLFSLNELIILPGFRQSRLREIAPFLTVQEGIHVTSKIRRSNMVLLQAGRSYPAPKGYQIPEAAPDNESAFAGTPLKTSVRIKSHAGSNLSFGMAYEKDAGEPFCHGKQPEFFPVYINYNGYRLLKQLVIGTFQLHHGMGLVNGSGFMHTSSTVQSNSTPLLKIRPYASLNENRFERGMGCRIGGKQMECAFWASYRQLDLSLNQISENPSETGWMEHERTTGLHRTTGEIAGRNMISRFYSGTQALFRLNTLNVGCNVSFERTGLTLAGLDSLKQTQKPDLNHSFSLHGRWHKNRHVIFGECAVERWSSAAILTGTTIRFNEFLQVGLLLHHYGPGYRGARPSSYASGSHIRNEQGVAIHLQAEPGKQLVAECTAELFRYPAPRFQTHTPSIGFKYSCTFNTNAFVSFPWKFRISHKVWQTTPKGNATGARLLKTSKVTRLDFRLIMGHESPLQWHSRTVVSLLSQHEQTIPAYAAVQQLRLETPPHLRCVLQFVVFHVSHWDNRIYLYEPGFYYNFHFPVYYGTGQKTSIVITVKPGKKISIAGKASVITHQNRDQMGTGNNQISGNRKWELGAQFRISF